MEHDVIKYSMYPAGANGSGSEQMQSPCALLTHCWPSVYLEILFFYHEQEEMILSIFLIFPRKVWTF